MQIFIYFLFSFLEKAGKKVGERELKWQKENKHKELKEAPCSSQRLQSSGFDLFEFVSPSYFHIAHTSFDPSQFKNATFSPFETLTSVPVSVLRGNIMLQFFPVCAAVPASLQTTGPISDAISTKFPSPALLPW